MEGNDHSLAPQWLKSSGSGGRVTSINNQLTSSPYSDHITYSGRRWITNSKGSGLSRSYSNSERRWHYSNWEKDVDNFDKDKLFLDAFNPDHSDYVDNILSNRIETNILRRTQSMSSGRWRETWSPRTSSDVSDSLKKHQMSHGSVTGVVGIKQKTALDKEFPSLGAEDKQQGSPELGSNNVPANASSSVAPGSVGLTMAKALVQGPFRSHTPPQLSTSTQKLEELALKQSRLLIPMTPSTPRFLVANSLEKSKVKTGKQQYPFSYSRRSFHSLHVAQPNSVAQKISTGNYPNVSASQELNDVSLGAKDEVGATTTSSISSPSRSSSNNSSSTASAWITLEKKLILQTQSRNDFFKNLSRKSSSNKPCSDIFPIVMPSCASVKSRDGSSGNTKTMNTLTEYSTVITQNGNAANQATNPVLYPDEEEIAFLRSLGWEESSGDDEGLTEEEIQDFYEKYKKLQL